LPLKRQALTAEAAKPVGFFEVRRVCCSVPEFIAILEDNDERLIQMRACLSELLPQLSQIYFDDASAMIAWLAEHLSQVVLISLDHDLPIDPDHGTGRQVVDYLATQPPVCPVMVHTSNEFFAPGMMCVLTDAGWPAVRVYPHSDHDWVQRGWAEQIGRLVASGWIRR